MTRFFVLSVCPYVSAQTNDYDEETRAGSAFGHYYVESQSERDNRDSFALPALLSSGDNLRIAAANAAWEWLQTHRTEIFHTICNFEYASERFYMANMVVFDRVEQAGKRIHFVFHEKAEGAVDDDFLSKMVEEVQEGGDTWDCGDFGDVVVEGDNSRTVRCTLCDSTAVAEELSQEN